MSDTRTFSPPNADFLADNLESAPAHLRVVVVGGGVMGTWTALQFLRNGCNVTLVESHSPGNSVSSSGGETRLIRAIYGQGILYSQLTYQSISEWKSLEQQQQTKLYHDQGIHWLLKEDSPDLYQPALNYFRSKDYPISFVEMEDFQRQYKFVSPNGIKSILLEEKAGFIEARKAVMAVASQFLAEGGTLKFGRATYEANSGKISSILLNAEKLKADLFVFCPGPWLGQIFPELAECVAVSRQEIHYFSFKQPPPVFTPWVDWDPEDLFYGVWDHDGRGLKVAHDVRGHVIDPDKEQRIPSKAEIQASIRYLKRRFPGITNEVISESRVCQYTNTVDGNIIIDQHPELHNCWIVGGGSGHAFKMGPAIGNLTYQFATGQRALFSNFKLRKF